MRDHVTGRRSPAAPPFSLGIIYYSNHYQNAALQGYLYRYTGLAIQRESNLKEESSPLANGVAGKMFVYIATLESNSDS